MNIQHAVAISRRPYLYDATRRGEAWAELRRKALNVPQWRANDLRAMATGLVEYESTAPEEEVGSLSGMGHG